HLRGDASGLGHGLHMLDQVFAAPPVRLGRQTGPARRRGRGGGGDVARELGQVGPNLLPCRRRCFDDTGVATEQVELLPDGADVLDHPGQQLPGDIADGIGRGREHVEAERGGAGEDVEDAGGVEAVGDLHHRLDSRDAGERTRAVVLDVDDGHGCSSPSACSVMALAAASSSAAKICAHSATRSPRILVPSAIWPIWPTAGSWICDFSNQPMGLPSTPNAKVRSSDSVAAAAASVMVASRSAKPATWSACADNSPDIAANTSLTTLPPLLSCASEPESP